MWNVIGYCWAGWGGSLWMWLVFLLVVGWVVWVVVSLVRRTGNQPDEQSTSRALDIAGERYARGEIGKEEFEQIKKNIS